MAQIRSGAERAAGAGQDGDPDLVVVAHRFPGIRQPHGHLRIDGVARLGAVQRDYSNVSLNFEVYECHLLLPVLF